MFLFGVRGFATGFTQAIGLYTPEVCAYIAIWLVIFVVSLFTIFNE